MKKLLPAFFFIMISVHVTAQISRVLFLGNSYTYVNNLPILIAQLALSGGDSLYPESNTPGGYTLGWQPIQHSTDSVSLAKIREGNWDFVVLQEQSQTPAIPALRDSCMLPASVRLFDSVKLYNPCAHVLFYQTWGRRFGGIQCFVPNYCSTNFADFGQMQDSVTKAYHLISEILDEPVAPAGEAWRLILNNTSMVLHESDDSHPNLNGSYLTACVFFSCIFKKPSYGLAFTAGLLPDSAAILQKAADSVVFSDPSLWNLWKNDPVSSFSAVLHDNVLKTDNLSLNSLFYQWDFGDGTFSTEFEPEHIYTQSGTFTVILHSCDSCICDTAMETFAVTISSSGDKFLEKTPEITGPDALGNIQFRYFDGNGFLDIHDLAGKKVAGSVVIKGHTIMPPLSAAVYLWTLTSDGKMIATGRFGIKNW